MSRLRATPGRYRLVVWAIASIYALGSLVHLAFWVSDPGIYERFGELALLDAYGSLWEILVVPRLGLLLPLVVVFEAGIALSILRPGRTARRGHLAGVLFQLGLAPSGPWGPINIALAWGHWRLARAAGVAATSEASTTAEPEHSVGTSRQ